MSEPNFSVNFTGATLATDGPIAVKDLLVFDSALGAWRTATTANRTTANAGSQAIALTSHGGSIIGSVSYQSSGVLATSISGLLPGAKQLVRTSATGRIERIASFTAGDDVIGYAEADGRVHLHFGLPWSIIATLGGIGGLRNWFDIMAPAYGAVGDGITDDSPAVYAAMTAMGTSFGTATGGVLYLPGNHYFAQDIVVLRPIRIVGVVQNQGNGPAKITFAPGKGFIAYGTGGDPTLGGRTATRTCFEHLDILSTPVTTTSYEGVATARTVGTKRLIPGCNWVYLECVKAGTDAGDLGGLIIRKALASSTNASPIVVTTAAPHGYVTDDIVKVENHTTNTAANGTWRIIRLSATTFSLRGSVGNGVGGATGTVNALPAVTAESDRSVAFTPNTVYRYGQIVRATTDGAVMAANGSNLQTAALYVVSSPALGASNGTSGASYPTVGVGAGQWKTTNGGTTVSGTVTFTAIAPADALIVDGTCVWATKSNSGILSRTTVFCDHVFVQGYANAGFMIRANVQPYDNANHSELRDCQSRQNGIGIMVSGADAQQVVGTNCIVESAGLVNGFTIPGNGGIGIYDGGLLSSTWMNCEVANRSDLGGGPSHVRRNGAIASVFINCYSEPGIGAVTECEFNAQAIVLGGDYGSPITGTSTHTAFEAANQGSKRVTSLNEGGATPLQAYLGQQDGVQCLGWSTNNDANRTGINYSNGYTGWAALGVSGWFTCGRVASQETQAWATPEDIATTKWSSGQAIDASTYPFWITQTRLHLGIYSDGDPPSMGFGTAAPVAGYYVQGSIQWKKNATVGQPIGWRCTVTGSPGTWVAMAVL